jgi:hypothetical protein
MDKTTTNLELDELELHLLRRVQPGSPIALTLNGGHRCDGLFLECRRGRVTLKTSAGTETVVRMTQIAAIEGAQIHAANR